MRYRKGVGEIVTKTGRVAVWRLQLTYDEGAQSVAPGPDGRLWLGSYAAIYAVNC